MLRKIKKIFFPSIFGILYISFMAQLVYIIGYVDGTEKKGIALAIISLEWLVIISARYLSKKSGGNNNHGNHNNYNSRRN